MDKHGVVARRGTNERDEVILRCNVGHESLGMLIGVPLTPNAQSLLTEVTSSRRPDFPTTRDVGLN